MKEEIATLVPFITFVPIANVVVYTTNAVCTCSTSPSSSARLSRAIVVELHPRTFESVIHDALGPRVGIQVGLLIYYRITLFLLSPDRAGEGVISKVDYCFTRILLGSRLPRL